MTTLRGKCSWFGGPMDTGVSPSEGLAFYYKVSDAPELFLDKQPAGTTGLARRLDPDTFFIATRWDYALTPKTMLPNIKVKVTNAKTGIHAYAKPADWGPHIDTNRCADISKGLMDALGLKTDEEVIVEYEPMGAVMTTYNKICISSGHGLKVRGAHGIIDEVDEARLVTERLAEELRARGVAVETYHDDVSKSQSENLSRITDWHNARTQDLAISVHFNAFEQTASPRGTEVLYYSQSTLAAKLSAAIASVGFIDRGPKQRKDLYVLANTSAPCVLLEVCFVDSEADCNIYAKSFDEICSALADQLGGVMTGTDEGEEGEELPPPTYIVPRIDIEVEGDVIVTVNGVQITGH